MKNKKYVSKIIFIVSALSFCSGNVSVVEAIRFSFENGADSIRVHEWFQKKDGTIDTKRDREYMVGLAKKTADRLKANAANVMDRKDEKVNDSEVGYSQHRYEDEEDKNLYHEDEEYHENEDIADGHEDEEDKNLYHEDEDIADGYGDEDSDDV